MSTPEYEAFSQSLKEFTKELPNFDHPMTDACAITDARLRSHNDQLKSFLNGHVADLQASFRSLQACPEADQFREFFADCHAKAAQGEPLFVLLMQGNNKNMVA